MSEGKFLPYLFQQRGIRVIYKGGIFVQKPVAVNPQRICKCYRCAVLDGVPVIFIQNQCRGHNTNLFRQFPCGEALECPVILQILARCGAFFIGFIVKGQMNHDFAFGIEVNPCVIEITIGKPLSYYAFEMLYWCGVREGELLALTPGDFDFEKQTVTISKSYQRIKGKDVITDPKTPKSNRVIQMPAFLCEEMRDYIKSLYGVKPTDRIFTVTKSYLHREMDRGAKEAGVKRIRIHDLRHSHISLLIDMGFTALAIADRVGHESIDITYRYAHLFPTRQAEMADKLDMERKGA